MSDEQKLRTYLKRATADLYDARQRVRELETRSSEPVAIVGMSCRYPGGARSPEDFWDLLVNGRDAIGGFPTDRGWDLESLFGPDPDRPGTSHAREGGFLHDATEFDSEFFGISPREALTMDPQQRLWLEASWEAVEDAGLDPASLAGTRAGVFAGVLHHDYGADIRAVPERLEGHFTTGIAGSVLSGRVAYVLGLEGPAVTVDTACSSSLVALHLACQSLRSGECSLALAGGVTVLVTPGLFVEFSRQRGLARDGRCKSFADAADGTGFSEGVGVVLLERLSEARRNGHRVLAVVRGSATNQDGASNGLTAPNGPSQERVIREALANAGLSPADVDAVEAHGTGTTLGDPIEAQALLATYGRDRPDGRPLWLGSVKSNIGHAQAAAGVAGVIKMVKALEHGVLPETLHVDEPSRHVSWSAGSVSLLTERRPWERNGGPRRAAVSSFGISGTNAHVILEEAPVGELVSGSVVDGAEHVVRVDGGVVDPVLGGGVVPWVLSGRGAGGLQGQAGRLCDFLTGETAGVGDVGLSLACRPMFEGRAVVVGGEVGELLGGVGAVARGESVGGVVRGIAGEGVDRAVFVFPGQGSQWDGMAVGMLDECPVFAGLLRGCDEVLSRYVGWSVEGVLRGEDGAPGLDRLDVVQPVLFAVMVALAGLWRACGVEPAAVVGHSQGEIAAAYVAGGLSLDDAARAVALRSRVLAGLSGEGGIVSVALPVADLMVRLERWDGRVQLAGVNGPSSVTVSGDVGALREFVDECLEDGVRARLVADTVASHSPRVDVFRDELCELLAGIEPRSGDVPFYSTVTGGLFDMAGLDGEYWFANMRQPVLFEGATRALLDDGFRVFVEASPHPVLTFGVSETADEVLGGVAGAGIVEGVVGRDGVAGVGAGDGVVVVGSLRRGEGGLERFLSSLGEVWVRGVGVDWGRVFAGCGFERVGLPSYAFQRERFWLDAGGGAGDVRSVGLGSVDHPLLGAVVGLAGGEGWLFTGRVSLRDDPWLADHAAMGTVLFPGTGFVELVGCAGRKLGCGVVRELVLEAPLVFSGDAGVRLQVLVGELGEDGSRTVSVFSRVEDGSGELEGGLDEREGWTRHATGVLSLDDLDVLDLDGVGVLGGVWPPEGAVGLDVDGVYERLGDLGLEYGPVFQGLTGAWRYGGDVLCEVSLPEDQAARASLFGVHPALFDAALHAMVLDRLASGGDGDGDGGVRLPFSWGEVRFGALGASSLRVRLSGTGDGEGVSLLAVDGDGVLVVSLGSLVARPVSPDSLRDTRRPGYRDSLFSIQWTPLPAEAQDASALPDEWVLLGSEDSPLAGVLAGSGATIDAYQTPTALSAALDQDTRPVPGVVLLDTTTLGDIGPSDDRAARDLPLRVQDSVCSVLTVIQHWLTDPRLAQTRLAILTHNAIHARPADQLTGLTHAAIWGLGRTAQTENPHKYTLIDTDDTTSPTQLASLLHTALTTGEPQLAIRENQLHTPRLTHTTPSERLLSIPDGAESWRLETGSDGTFESLALAESADAVEPLDVGEVRVDVRTAGLNFRDVVVALGMLSVQAPVGSEGAGVVLEVGPGVEDLAVGDRVMGLLVRGVGPVAVTDRRLLVGIPDNWSFAKAASVPIAFLTAFYGLVDLAGLGAGERVLVHAAAGGVGMAAVQIAQHLGAEVFATASPSKWEALRSLGLDDSHIASSRTLEFKDRFLEQTGGAGVDVVLDSLAREFVDASLELLVGGGRFVEMGKTDIRDPQELAAQHPGVTYRAFDLTEAGPDRIEEMWHEIVGLLDRGVLEPLPMVAWDMRRAPEAFRHMSQGRHTGKIVLTLPARIESEGTVLITGGTGGLGALVARHLVGEHGVRSLLLASRRGRDAPGAAQLQAELVEQGVQVRIAACDVSDREALGELLRELPAELPLRGVVHAAAALDDGVVDSLDESRVERVLAPKAHAAWHLHELTEDLDLSMFVLFSSAAGSLGAPGQGNYAAANAFLDALASYRRARGLAGTSIAWGHWEQASELTSGLSEADLARMAREGMLPISPEEGLGLFDLAHGAAESALIGLPVDVKALRAQARAGLLPVLMSGLVSSPLRRSAVGGSLAVRLAGLPEAQRESTMLELVRGEVAIVLGHSAREAIDPVRAFKDLGFDSLAAVELRNRLNTATGLGLPATLVFDHPNSKVLARYLLDEIAGVDSRQRSLAVGIAGISDEPIAIVGMSCRYPGGARSPEDFWNLVANGVDAIDGFPTDRGWNLDDLFDPDPDRVRTSYVRDGGFLHDAGDFDPGFFGISPREALAMEPQQRLFLEACWEAIEDGGIDPASLRGGETGVFVGAIHQDYGLSRARVPDSVEPYLGTGVSTSVLSGRVAYVLGLEGPAVTVDTACSSSLVALHLACGALRAGECSSALAGGVAVLVSPGGFVDFSRQHGLAPDGRCKSFSDAADGTGLAEGVGVVLLERVSDAQRNGHRVLAVVRGSATNQDGASNGLTAPSGSSQERVIRQALANAGLSAADVDAVEAHGTGTTLGDPIEARALLATYGSERRDGRPLWLGSVKSNIGHAQAAAGVAGVIKMVKALEHGVLPQTLHADEPSSKVDWDTGAVSLLSEATPWERNGAPRRAAVSSFGMSGTNAHLILEEPSAGVSPVSVRDGDVVPVLGGGVVPWVLSGVGVGGLCGQAGRLCDFLMGGAVGVGDVGLSLACRPVFGDRAVVVGGGVEGLLGGVGGVGRGELVGGVVRGVARGGLGRVVFVFPGQGGQWEGMAVGLLDECPVFAGLLRGCDEVLSRYVGWSVEGVLRGEVGAPGLDRLDVVQPVLFAVMVALAGLWRACGVEPAAVVGHSQGEIAAAYVAGGLSLDDAARVVVLRSRVLAGLSGEGGIVSVALPVADLMTRLEGWEGRVELAGVNGPSSVTVSGDVGALEEFVGECVADGVRARLVADTVASHSPRVDVFRDELCGLLEGIEPCSGDVPFYSTVTGGLFDMAGLDGEYWFANMRQPVLFEGATRALLDDGFGVFVEAGPHPVLTFGVSETADDVSDVVVVGSLRRGEGGLERFLLSLGEVWVRGVGVDWARVFAGCGFGRVGLPSYAFQRERFWLDAGGGVGDVRSVGLGSVDHPLLGAVVGLAGGDGWLFSGRVSLEGDGWLADHAVLGSVLFPGTGFVELVGCAGRKLGCGVVRELVLEAPLVLSGGTGFQLQVVVGEPAQDGERSVSVYSRPEDAPGASGASGGMDGEWLDGRVAWTRHATGILVAAEDESDPSAGVDESNLGLGANGVGVDGAGVGVFGGVWPPVGAVGLDVDGVYERLGDLGLEYGPVFQGLTGAWRCGGDVFCEVSLPEDQTERAGSFGLHPALFDAALHAMVLDRLASGDGDGDGDGGVRLPFSWGEVRFGALGASSLRVRLSGTGDGEGVSLLAVDQDGALVVSLGSLVARPVSRDVLRDTRRPGYRDSLFSIQWTLLPTEEQDAGALPGEWVLLGSQDSPLAGVLAGSGATIDAYQTPTALSAALDQDTRPAPGVVLLDTTTLGDTGSSDGARDLPQRVQDNVCSVLSVIQHWLTDPRLAHTRLAILTHNAIHARPADQLTGLTHAAIWGLTRSAQTENPHKYTLIDTDDTTSPTQLASLLHTALTTGEPQLAIRENQLHTPRLTHSATSDALAVPDDVSEWCLEAGGAGTFEDLSLVPSSSASERLGSGQVRVSVRAAGLNFRDVLISLGMLPGEAPSDEVFVGAEGAGVVLEIGPGVEDLAVGDCVMGMLVRGFGPVAVADRHLLVGVPDGWSFAQAASVPSAFLTAFYGLVDLAGLGAGERVLVHAAAGGVGMAAVQIAQHLGAEVFATASPSKWEALRSLGLDDSHIASSRTLEFKDRFLEQTGGAGVDVVLDSLVREFVDASLELLVGGGRFVEMGKTDIRDPQELAAQHPGVTYRAFDLAQAGSERLQGMLGELRGLFDRGVLEPLPMVAWDMRRAPEAFRHMSQARHRGKIVLIPPPDVDRDGTVLITGGTGTLGALLARHLVAELGVRSLLLVSRRGPDAPGAAELRDELESLGARVTIAACDVSDREAMQGLLGQVPAELPLRGVVHAAAALDDGVIGLLTDERIERVLAPKIHAAWHLHELTEHLDLSMFVLFSSAAATMGSPGQGSYAAANAFLDALASHRRARGLAGTSIAWGYWESVSELTSGLSDADLARMTRQGVLPMSTEEGLALFDAAQSADLAALVAMRVDVAAARAQARAGSLPVLMSDLVRVSARRAADGGSLARRLASVPQTERETVVLELVCREVAVVLGHASPRAIDPQRAFRDLGFDSLAAVELRNRLNAVTGLRLPTTVVFDHPNSIALTRHLLGEVGSVERRRRSLPVASVTSRDDPVAIVGMSCRYPGGIRSAQELWELVAGGGDAIGQFPADRGWELERLFDPDPDRPGTSYAREGGFLYDATGFDAEFFGVSPREALAIDPQQRVLLETSWEAVENAGIDPNTLRHTPTGVFAGVAHNDYGMQTVPAALEGYMATGVAGSVASGRISYVLGLEGPAVTVDTACSSSLVALHLACQSLHSGECSLALAGGATVLASPKTFMEFSKQRGLARDGRCKSFADAADGAGFSEGVGVLVLERLSDARRNGHRALAVVRGSAMNQDGASNGLTAPNGPSQERVIRQALANAGLRMEEVDAVEAHGTGTALGDPIEARALLATYGRERREGRPLWLGSVKSNIGHSQAAAGVAGVIKMVKALEHGVLPQTLHVDEPSRHVDWSVGDVSLLTEQLPWECDNGPRRAGVSSFGISGTNVHVILEDAAVGELAGGLTSGDAGAERVVGVEGSAGAVRVLGGGVVPWVLSGVGVGGLSGQAVRLGGFLGDGVGSGVGDVGLSLAGRPVFGDRAVVVGGEVGELLGGVGAVARGELVGGVARGVARGGLGRVVFVFPGQGGQWEGMAVGLLDECPVFAGLLGECGKALSRYVGWSVEGVLRGEVGAPGLDRVDVVQPVLFAVMVALAGLWRECGVEPAGVVGHSQGEIAAAYVAGGLSLDDAARVVALRSRLLAGLSGEGGMASVALGASDVISRLERWGDRVALAAVNGPSSVVVSGEPDALDELLAECAADGVRARSIAVDYAAHSERVESMRAELLAGCADIEPCSGGVPFYSTVTGGLFDMAGLGGEYWFANMRQPVLFEGATRALLADGFRVFVEAGPHPVLTFGVSETADDVSDVVVVSSLRRGEGGLERFLLGLGELWVEGVQVDWARVFAGCGFERVGLPSYAFQRERFWLDAGGGVGDVRSVGLGSVDHPLLGAVVGLAGGDGWLFSGRVSLEGDGWLADHAVLGSVLFPGTGFVELVGCAGRKLGCGVVRELVLEAPLVLSGGTGFQLQVVVGEPAQDGERSVSVYSRPEDASGVSGGMDGEWLDGRVEWTRHATGVLVAAEDESDLSVGVGEDGLGVGVDVNGVGVDGAGVGVFGGVWPPVGAVGLDVDGVYERLGDLGLEYGPVFQGLTGAWRCGGDVFCEVSLPEGETGRAGSFGLHPALFDAALHAMVLDRLASGDGDGDGDGGVRLPFSWGDVRFGVLGASSLRVRLSKTGDGDGEGVSLLAVDQDGVLVVSLGSLVARPVSRDVLRDTRGRGYRDSLFGIQWSPIPVEAQDASVLPDEWVLLGSEDSPLAGALGGSSATIEAYQTPSALSAALDENRPVPGVVLLDTITLGEAEPSGDSDDARDLPRRVQDNVCRVLSVIQHWLTDPRLAQTRLAILTHNAIHARPADQLTGLTHAAIWGLGRTAQTENPHKYTLIDTDDTTSPTQLASLLHTALTTEEPQLAIRENQLHTPRLTHTTPSEYGGVEPIAGGDLLSSSQVGAFSSECAADSTVLITGGTGGLGGLVARRLAVEHGVASLLLASRRGIEAPGATELQQELESLGARVGIVACDVSDREAVRALLEQVPAEFPLRGVVHAAGALDDGVIGSLTAERVERVLAPKAKAAWHLHELTQDLSLPMFVLFSSAAGSLGSPGQGNYAAANSFLDSLAAYRRARGLAGSSIAWGYWEQASELTGGLDETDIARMARQGVLPMSAEEGLALFDAAVESDWPALVAMRIDTATLHAQARTGLLPVVMSKLVRTRARRAADSGSLARRLAGVPPAERESAMLEFVRGEIASVLGYDSASTVEPERAFKDLGFDSLAAVELRNRLSATTGLRLPATLVFDHPNASALACYLLERFPLQGVARSIDGELDELEQALSSVAADHAERTRIAARLQTLLSALVDPDQARDSAASEEDAVQLATDDQLFELIDEELGTP